MVPIINFHGGDEDSGEVFVVETFAPAGHELEQHKHDHAHLSLLALGVADVTVDGVTTRYEGPTTVKIAANKTHSVRAVTAIAWYCLWADSLAPKELAYDSLKFTKGGEDAMDILSSGRPGCGVCRNHAVEGRSP